MLLLQAHEAAAVAADAAAHPAFEPTLLGWIVLLPLIGFLINGVAGIVAARRAVAHNAPALESGHGESEQEGHADEHPFHEPETEAHAPRGWTHRLPSFVAPGVMIAAFVLAAINFFGMLGAGLHEPVIRSYWSWLPVGELQIEAALQLDPLSMLMTLIITGVGSLIHIFSIGYMKEDPGYPRYFAYLNLFVFFMLVLVLGSSYTLMFVGWEGVGLCSYLLIGFWFRDKANADAGKKAFIVNRIGDVGFLIAMFLLFANLGTLTFTDVFAAAPERLAYAGPVVTAICVFFIIGAMGKSAQIPLYVWLPDAMAGPTPVSALIHAATMVTAGVYLVVRSSVLFTMAPSASLFIAAVGALTAIFAASIGIKQWDIKKVLAYSTVSQLGFMFAGVGMGAYTAGVFHLMTHAFFKACLFLGSGAVIHAMHGALHATHSHADAQDMRNMGALKKYLPVTFVTMGLATLAIAGIPPFSGFFSKDEIIGAAWLGMEGHSIFSEGTLFGLSGRAWMGAIGVTLTISALMTAFYMGRMMIYTFFGDKFRAGREEEKHLHEGDWTLTLPLIVLGALSLLGGFLNVETGVPIVRWFNWFGLGEGLHRWLHPVLAGSEAVAEANLGPMGEVHHAAWPIILAIAIGVGGLVLAWVLLKPAALGDEKTEPAYEGELQKALYNKWYVDEAYDRTVVQGTWGLSAFFSRFIDRGLIDGIVDGLGRAASGFGLLFGRVQSGQVNTYAFVIIVGVLAVLAGFTGVFGF